MNFFDPLEMLTTVYVHKTDFNRIYIHIIYIPDTKKKREYISCTFSIYFA